MQLTEKDFSEIENDLIRFFRNTALPRFMKALRNAVELGIYDKFEGLNGVKPSSSDFIQEFVDWISFGNLTPNLEVKTPSGYPKTREIEDWEEERESSYNVEGRIPILTDEDIPF